MCIAIFVCSFCRRIKTLLLEFGKVECVEQEFPISEKPGKHVNYKI